MQRTMRRAVVLIVQTLLVILTTGSALAANTTYLAGCVYRDSNGNSLPDSGEELALATVFIQHTEADAPILLTTDANGMFVATDLIYGAYRVWATDAEQNLSPVQAVTLGEVNATVILDLLIVHDRDDVEHRSLSNVFLPLVNR